MPKHGAKTFKQNPDKPERIPEKDAKESMASGPMGKDEYAAGGSKTTGPNAP